MSYKYESNATKMGGACPSCHKRSTYSELKNTSHYTGTPGCLSGAAAFQDRSNFDKIMYKKFVHNDQATPVEYFQHKPCNCGTGLNCNCINCPYKK